MKNLKSKLVDFYRDEEGASGIEYALVAAMVAIALTAFIPGIREAIENIFTEIRTSLTASST